MNAAVIDTNVLINCFQRGGGAADAISDYDRILVCPAVIAEFKAGIDTSTKRGGKAKDRLDEFLDDPAVEFVPCTEETAEYYARIPTAATTWVRPSSAKFINCMLPN